MLPFHTPLEQLKLNYHGLLSTFSKYFLKLAQSAPFTLFTALVFDSNYFGVLIWKIVKPRDYNKLKAILKAFDKDF